jgi:hypothetical protein
MTYNESENIFIQAYLPQNMSKMSVFVFGIKDGEIIIECINRGCKRIVGVGSSNTGIDTCKALLTQYNSQINCSYDISFVLLDAQYNFFADEIIKRYGFADLVICINEMENEQYYSTYYSTIAKVTNDVCVIKTCGVNESAKVIDHMKKSSFDMALEFDNHICIMKKHRDVYASRVQNDIYDHFVSRYYDHVITENIPFQSTNNQSFLDVYHEHADHIKQCYEKIKHIEYVAHTDFYKYASVTPYYDQMLINVPKTPEFKACVKQQLVTLVREMNIAGVAHRDMHIKNFCVWDGKIILIDFEYLCENKCEFENCYDLTGNGIESPLQSGQMNIFHLSPFSFWSYFDEQLTMNDFLTKDK